MLVQLPCDIKEARHSMQFQPRCFRTIVIAKSRGSELILTTFIHSLQTVAVLSGIS